MQYPVQLISLLLQIILSFGLITISIKAISGAKIAWNDIFSKFGSLIKYFLSTILYGLLLVVGLIPLMVAIFIFVARGDIALSNPTSILQNSNAIWLISILGILALLTFGWYVFMAVKYQFYSFSIADKNSTILGSFKNSAKITSGVKSKLIMFLVVLTLLNIVTAVMTFGFGIIVTMPLSMLALASVYRKITLQSESNDALLRIDPATSMKLPHKQ